MEKVGNIAEEVINDLRKDSISRYLEQLIERYKYKRVKTKEEVQDFIAEIDEITAVHRDSHRGKV